MEDTNSAQSNDSYFDTIYPELVRQYDAVLDRNKALESRSVQLVIAGFTVIGLGSISDVTNLLRTDHLLLLHLVIVGLLLVILSIIYSCLAFKVSTINIGIDTDYLIKDYRYHRSRMKPNIIKGISGSLNRMIKINDIKGRYVQNSEILITFGTFIFLMVIIYCRIIK